MKQQKFSFVKPTFSDKAKRLVESKKFNLFVGLVIICGAILAGISVDPKTDISLLPLIDLIEWAILAFFCVEIALRILAEGNSPLKYFKDPWNLFDFLIVAACFIPIKSRAIFVLRLVRILRTLRLFRAFPKLRMLINGMVASLSSIIYVAFLLLLLIYIYAVIGVSLFAQADPSHFGSVFGAIFTLFQVLTLESWNVIMLPVVGVFPVGGPIYFVSFIILGVMLIMNLILGVIVNNMGKAMKQIEKDTYIEAYLDEDAERERKLLQKMESIESQLLLLNKKISAQNRAKKK